MSNPFEEPARVPASPDELIAHHHLQRSGQGSFQPATPPRQRSEKVNRFLQLLQELKPCAWEKQEIALELLQQLENFHEHVLEELQDDTDSCHRRIARWAVDADRLYRARMILEAIHLE